MFTGIIEGLGVVQKITEKGSNKTFSIKSDIAPEMKVDESICHNGVCLTVEDISNDIYKVTAIKETLDKTNIGTWKTKESINLERSMKMNGRLDGHIVQGHVDSTATCTSIKDTDGSHEFTFEFDEKFAGLIIEKGSICLNGISLTIFNVTETTFTVGIIPYTFEHTNIQHVKNGCLRSLSVSLDFISQLFAQNFT